MNSVVSPGALCVVVSVMVATLWGDPTARTWIAADGRVDLSASWQNGTAPSSGEMAFADETTFELVDSFPIEQILNEKNFKSLYYYYGIVTMGRVRRGHLSFRIPNECVRRQIFEYMRSEYAKRPNAAP